MKKSISFYLFGLFLLLFATQTNAVTFNVTVPNGTVKCFVAGAFNSWSTTTSLELTKVDATHFNLDAPVVTSVSGGFKYLCGPGPGWTYVEKNADGSERSNRIEATTNDVVARWAALYAPDLVPGPVTLIVNVPNNTPDNKVYVYGSFQGWIVEEALQLTKISATQYTITIPDVTQFNYKILCGKSTTYVEVDASGADIPDRNAASSTPTINITVLKWKNVTAATVNGVTYLEENISFSPLNGTRNIWVYLPPDYAINPEKRYPVLYMQDGQNVFSEEKFSSSVDYPVGSWDVATTLNKMYDDGKNVGIVIAIDKTPEYKSEYSPWKNNDFSQSGTGNEYLQAVINNIIPYVNSHYRTLTGPANTAIAGSDMGGLISYYAALKHQSVFGKAGIFSPSFWFNKADLNTYLASWTKNESSKMYIITGDKEGTTMNTDAQLFFDATKTKGFTDDNIKREIFKGGTHQNTSWAVQFRRVYAYLFNIVDIIPPPNPTAGYQFMSHSATTDIVCGGEEAFVASTYFPSGFDVTPNNVMSYVKTVPADVKTTYNWNINDSGNCVGANLFSTNKSINFNSSKNTESWIRAMVSEDKSVSDLAVSSNSFKVKKANGTFVNMTRTTASGTAGEDDTFTVSAEVVFSGSNKNFEIHSGNVNDGSDQGSVCGLNDTYPLFATATCIKTQIIYSFKTNKVVVKCLDESTSVSNYQFMSHSATSPNVQCSGLEPFIASAYYPTGIDATPLNVMTYIKTIPVEIKTIYYWNINEGSDCAGANLYATNKSVGFSSAKAYESWTRAIVKEDKTVLDVNASSAYFRVKKADATLVVMSRTKANGTAGSDDSFTVSANVTFPTVNKNFEIRFGSVNSGSIQASLVGSNDTYPLSVSANCTNAQIIYSFKTNKVKIIEITDPVILPTISYLKAIPSVCNAGTPVTVSALMNDATGYDLTYSVSQNSGAYINQPFTINAQNELVFNFTSSAGIYFIQLKAKKGTDAEIVFPQICVKVLSGTIDEKTLSENPYQNVNWTTVGKYKGTFHVHTDWSSDATLTADAVVDLYHSKNYKILPLTNHDFNSYPWTVFSMFKSTWQDRDPQALSMLTFPATELSGNNHHNDFFTGRNDDGANLEESFTKTEAMGGLQLINHPGQYWSIGNTYTGLEKNSAAWHADNFKRHASLIGLEVYNQANKHVSDRILWDEILTLTMPQRPVWGYSNDDFHNLNMAFFNYEYMLMDEFTIPALKIAMKTGKSIFSYEYGASGNALAPSISSIIVNEETKTITITTPDNDVSWICGTEGSGSTRKSAVIGYGKTFFYDGFKGNYVRALIKNGYGETCTQPFGFEKKVPNGIDQQYYNNNENSITVYPNPASNKVFINSIKEISQVQLVNLMGQTIKSFDSNAQKTLELDFQNIKDGVYVIRMKCGRLVQNKMIVVKR
ncbi:MAG: alpha/beta hydrolase-fold protein [Bacteroidales bacterium]